MKRFPHPLMTPPAPTRSGPTLCPRAFQSGAFFISFALMLTVVLGFVGMALDVGQIYNRKIELQNIADSAALAAAAALDGSAAGVDNAVAAAARAAGGRVYRSVQPVQWNDAAISFAATPGADASGWFSASAARASPANMLFAQVDTGALDASYGLVATPFMAALGTGVASLATSGRAVAGRMSISVTPLGICALDPAKQTDWFTPPSSTLKELVEWGFRRGVGYNLLDLSSAGTTPLQFLIDPIDAAGTSAANFATDIVAPFVCSGTMPMWSLPNTVHVQFPFPAATFSDHLNSRFNQYPGGAASCDPIVAPPDRNVREFTPANVTWMSTNQPTASSSSINNPLPVHLATIAEIRAPQTIPTGTAATAYGVLWSYARPVTYASPPPAGGYVPLPKSNWPTLYPVNSGLSPAPNGVYPSGTSATSTPYYSGSFTLKPLVNTGLVQRRVLNIPLFDCTSASSGTTMATVLAIGQFFMTERATATAIYAEFAGVVTPQALGGHVGLYP